MPRNPPPMPYWKAAVISTRIKTCSLFTESLTLLTVLWHHRNSPLFKDQLKAWSQHSQSSALRWSTSPQNTGHCSTSTLHFHPRRERQLLQPASKFAGPKMHLCLSHRHSELPFSLFLSSHRQPHVVGEELQGLWTPMHVTSHPQFTEWVGAHNAEQRKKLWRTVPQEVEC